MIIPFLLICLAIWSFIVGAVWAAVTGGAPFNGASMLGVILALAGIFLAWAMSPKDADR